MKKYFTLLAMVVMLVTSSFAATITPIVQTPNYLKFMGTSTTVSFNQVGTQTTTPLLQFSRDGKTWVNYTLGNAVALNSSAGTSVYFRAKMRVVMVGTRTRIVGNTTFSQDGNNYIQFKSTGNVAASGSIMSLIDTTCTVATVPAKAFCKMFLNCTKLTSAPTLSATTLKDSCYAAMFYGCTGLTKAPALPATSLANYCYSQMFQGCSGITEAPALPATTLAPYCYQTMFNGCTGLTSSPALPATTLVDHCYQRMFSGCTNLNNVTVSFTDWNSSASSTSSWLNNVASTGTFNGPISLVDQRGINYIPTGWQRNQPLYFEALSASTTVAFNIVGTLSSIPNLVYSVDGGASWNTYTFGNKVTLANIGDRVFFCAKDSNATFNEIWYKSYINFTSNCAVEAHGNIMSLLNATCEQTATPDYAFVNLFANSTITTSPLLPATTLGEYCYCGMFEGSNLNTVPQLPATTLADGCYYCMFRECKNIEIAPSLPATTLADDCYRSMFQGCTSLFATPALPATYLEKRCYGSMFKGCTAIQATPKLPATKTVNYCYEYMFSGCTSLKEVMDILATSVFERSYQGMFEDCTSLTEAPALPATELSAYCYKDMFSGCKLLQTAPELPATVLYQGSYECMFYNCVNLTRVTTAASILDEKYTKDWLYNVSQNGNFSCPEPTNTERRGASYIPYNWKVNVNKTLDYLSFTAASDSTKLCILVNGTISELPKLEYTTTSNYPLYKVYTIEQTITLNNAGDKVYFRASDKNATFSKDKTNCLYFSFSDKVNAKGNIMSLLDATCKQTTVPMYAFSNLFNGCSNLNSAPELPATTLASSCYYMMFNNCTSLSTAPKLPALEMADGCYGYMFCGCTTLAKAPALPATKLAPYCYQYMFANCTSILSSPELPATTLAESCYKSMFSGAGLTTAPALPATKMEPYCYLAMFQKCLFETAPALPATSLANHCYDGMFQLCDNLVNAPELPATTLAEGCYCDMFDNCRKLVIAPTLPATTLVKECYSGMFNLCEALRSITVKFTEWDDAEDATKNWYQRINTNTATGYFYCPKELEKKMETNKLTSHIFTDWTVIQESDIDYLCFTAQEDKSIVKFGPYHSNEYEYKPSIQFSYDGFIWYEYTYWTEIKLPVGGKVFFKAKTKNEYISKYDESGNTLGYYLFAFDGAVAASGNVMSLLDATCKQTYVPERALSRLFAYAADLVSAPKLPATTLGKYCYEYMFRSCSSLAKAPDLPATTLAPYCYFGMFYECTSLSQAPELVAPTLADGCYHWMFYNDNALRRLKVHFTDWGDITNTYQWMVYVGFTGTFVCPEGLDTSKIDVSHIPTDWTVQTFAADSNILGLANLIYKLKNGLTGIDVNGDNEFDIKDIKAYADKILEK